MARPKSVLVVNRADPPKAGQARTTQCWIRHSGIGSAGEYCVSVSIAIRAQKPALKARRARKSAPGGFAVSLLRAMSNKMGGISPGPSSAVRCLTLVQWVSLATRTSCDSVPITSQSPGDESAEAGWAAVFWPEMARVRAWTAEVSSWMAWAEGSLMQIARKARTGSGGTSSTHDQWWARWKGWGTKWEVQKPKYWGCKNKSTDKSKEETRKENRDHGRTTIQRTGQRPRQVTKQTDHLKHLGSPHEPWAGK